MSKSRTKRGDKELDLLDKLKHENAKLKREVSALRKNLERIDFERFANLQELVEKQRKESEAEDNATKREKLAKKWACWDCGKDFLRILIWDHPVKGTIYYRKCNTCGKRTNMKPYKDDVEGIKEDE